MAVYTAIRIGNSHPHWRHRRARRGTGLLAATVLALMGVARTAHSQLDIAIPSLVYDERRVDEPAGEDDQELDLANVVQSAARGVTTVQEAPAIVTVVTAEEIQSRGYRSFEQLIDGVPGWMRYGGYHSQFALPMTRGMTQAALFMHNGVSLFDAIVNWGALWRVQPLENIKRVELVTGPGGVLWGANSFLGIINVITKDAEDIDGVEAGISAADGNGDRRALRGYLMAGIPELFGDRAKLFAHASFETFRGPGFEMPSALYVSAPPLPSSDYIYGPLTRAEPPRSMVFNLDGKLSAGPVTVTFQLPFAERHLPLGYTGFVTRDAWPEDTLELPDGMLACPFEEPYVVENDRCLDKGRTARDNEITTLDRYLVGEYRARRADGKAGFTIKGYGVQHYNQYPQLAVFSAVPQLLEGGAAFELDATGYRVGASLDGDVELGREVRVLYGAEGLHDWLPASALGDATRSRQGEGAEVGFSAPQQLERLPLPCPREPDPDQPGSARFVAGCPLTILFSGSRTVLGAYLNPQWRPTRALTLDAGARLQVAPAALGRQRYDLTPIVSGGLVYNFLSDWHLKLNYAEGFRPPTFYNTNSNGEAINYRGDPDLAVETSQAGQAELNARLFKGERRLREVAFRADYSYTRVENYIANIAAAYENTADRGIHSAELLGKVYLQGGHRIELAYTFLRMSTADYGAHKAVPEHWFNLTGVFNVVDDRAVFTTNLRVMSATEDPNGLVEYRDLGYDDAGGVIDVRTGAPTSFVVHPHELVMDRLPPGAELSLGVTWTPTPRWRLSAFTYNTFGARAYQPEPYFSYEPRLEFSPNPYEDFSARVAVSCTY